MSIYQHYKEEEHQFIDQILSWVEKVETFYESHLTNFLNPREQELIAQVIGTNHEVVKFSFLGGHEHSERKRALIFPFYESPKEEDFSLAYLETNYHEKFVNLSHRDVLGAFISLGIERKMIGDIIVGDGLVQLVTTKELAFYVRQNLQRIKNTTVSFQPIKKEKLLIEKDEWNLKTITVSSLRLDAVISEIYNISRKLAAEAVINSRIQVNFQIEDDVKMNLKEKDLISFRGKGRSKLIEIKGMTRKKRTRLLIGQLKL